jgi:hypothetical protein
MKNKKAKKKMVHDTESVDQDFSYVVRHDEEAEEKIKQLTKALEEVNAALIRRNDELAKAQEAANREIIRDVVVLTALLDAKAYLQTKGGIEAALIIQSISQVEQRLGPEVAKIATAIQELKALAIKKQSGAEIYPEDFETLLAYAQKLL